MRNKKRAAEGTVSTAWISASTIIPRVSLVISKAKIEAVEVFLKESLEVANRCHLLVIHGPSCSGKTALVWSIAADLNITIVQVDELLDVDHASESHSLDYLSTACMNNAKFPALSLVKPAQIKCSSMSSLRKVKAVLIDDLEGISEQHQVQLAKALHGLEKGIFILTCSDWYSICRNVKGFRELQVCDIALNPLAPTFIHKALKYWAGDDMSPPKELVESGDLRSCLYHAYLESISCHSTFPVMSSRDANLTIFHALGRLFYPLKQKEKDLWNPYIPDDRYLFHLYMHHNMLPFMANINEALLVLESLSLDNYEHSLVPLPEYTLAVLSGRAGRTLPKIRPNFTKPEYLGVYRRKPLKNAVYGDAI